MAGCNAAPRAAVQSTSRREGRLAPCWALRQYVARIRQRLVENGHGEIDVGGGDGQRRRDPPYRPAFRPTADVHAEAQFQAALGGQSAQLVMGLARFAVADELDAPEQAHAPDVANLLEA